MITYLKGVYVRKTKLEVISEPCDKLWSI